MPWTRKRKMLTGLALSLAVLAAWPCLIAFTFYHNLTAWRCPPRQVSSLAEIPNVGPSLSAWQTVGPVYYRYRPGPGGHLVVVAGTTSLEAITAFRAVGCDVPDRDGVAPKRITEAVAALSSVPGSAFRQSEGNLSFRCGADVFVTASFDPRSGWFVSEVESHYDSDMD
jgi:hypothetical protein